MGTDQRQGWTTASVEAVPRLDVSADPTPGLVMVFSLLHEQLPSIVPFVNDPTTLGREADNTLSIPEAAVSRYHARVERRAGGHWIIDNGSTNGTVVNGARVQAHRLRDHDVVRVGDTIFRYADHTIYRFGAYRVSGEVVEPVRPVEHEVRHTPLVGGYQIDAILECVSKVAQTLISVVVTGESGTGKELVAREIHRLSGRRGPLQAINCAALPSNLLESELFGYKRGAFTGATSDKVGLVRAADRGTLFLDEVGDMPLEAQAKLLRVLQEREVVPLGSTVAEPVDVRVVCATHRDLEQRVAGGQFRGDLLARLRELEVRLPPLRERREDLLLLVRSFLQGAGRPRAPIRFPFMLALAHYDWPYNVRELESAVKLALALSDTGDLDLRHLPTSVRRCLDGHGNASACPPASSPAAPPVLPPSQGLPGHHRAGARSTTPSEQELRALLELHQGNIAAVGRVFGKERMQVHRWLKRLGIDPNPYRSNPSPK